MNSEYLQYVKDLNNDDVTIRLDSLKKLVSGIEKGDIPRPESKGHVNNHIHTTYSFSPYSPTKALWMAYNSGLTTVGIMDHDSISGAREFIEAGKIIGIATTIGVECRVDFSGTTLNGRRINNPDQNSIAYVTLHGIPHTMIDRVKAFFAPYVNERNNRNRQMVDRINTLLLPHGINIDFHRDIAPLSMNKEGGSITERHILFALSLKLISVYGKGEKLLAFLKENLKLRIGAKIESLLGDSSNPFYEYDLLGALKSDMVAAFYINADAECPDVAEIIKLSKEIGAISAYAYLGDVGDSVTGDKKTQKFEDDYIEILFETIESLGFNAVTYMPSRNTMLQLERLKGLCDSYGFFQISGEDINSPRQSFVCDALENDEFKNLIESTWALIGHERAATGDITKAMFSKETVSQYPNLDERIKVYSGIGKNM